MGLGGELTDHIGGGGESQSWWGCVSKILGILTEGWEAGGGLIFTREANIAEMNVSEPSKNALKVLQKNIL